MQGTIKSFEELMEYNLELKKQEREAEKELKQMVGIKTRHQTSGVCFLKTEL